MVEWGNVAYDAYCRCSGGKSLVSGAKLPPWEGLNPEIRKAWEAAAEAIRDALSERTDAE